MKRSTLKGIAFAAALVLCFFAFEQNKASRAAASASGPTPGNTNAPGESNCTACHTSFPINSGDGSVRIDGLPPVYSPGRTYRLTITTSQLDAVNFGFQMTGIKPDGAAAGIVTATSDQTKVVSGTIGGKQRRYAEHTIDGVVPTEFGFKSWAIDWTAPAQRVGKVDFYAAGNGANGDGTTSLDNIYTTRESSLAAIDRSDFDADRQTDLSVFRPSTGIWYSYSLSTGQIISDQFGQAGDVIVPGDYDGSGHADFAVFRPSSGDWYLYKRSDGAPQISVVRFGSAGDIPAASDYDGDGITDRAVFRPSAGLWFLDRSTNGPAVFQFGAAGDIPVPADYDGDGRSDIALFRPSNGIWYLMRSTGGEAAVQFGSAGDRPVPADYDGDGRFDISVFRPSSGAWYRLFSAGGGDVTQFGLASDIPAPGDFDSDGKADISVFRPADGIWFLVNSSNSTVSVWFFGSNGDVPVSGTYLP